MNQTSKKSPSVYKGLMKSTLNPFKPNGISHCYELEQSISVLREVGWYSSFLFKF